MHHSCKPITSNVLPDMSGHRLTCMCMVSCAGELHRSHLKLQQPKTPPALIAPQTCSPLTAASRHLPAPSRPWPTKPSSPEASRVLACALDYLQPALKPAKKSHSVMESSCPPLKAHPHWQVGFGCSNTCWPWSAVVRCLAKQNNTSVMIASPSGSWHNSPLACRGVLPGQQGHQRPFQAPAVMLWYMYQIVRCPWLGPGYSGPASHHPDCTCLLISIDVCGTRS